jgi:hypothetical protein
MVKAGTLSWTAAAVGVFLLSLARSLADGPAFTDERWFLQVVHRIGTGDVLYRDVFFGSTPLSVYITSYVTRFTGMEAIAVKAVTNLAFTATVLIACWIARAEGMSAIGRTALASLLIVVARPYSNPPYTPVAVAFAIATAAAVLDGTGRRAVVIGVLAGLSFASKHNVGLLALVAALVAIGIDRRRSNDGLRTATAVAAFSATVVTILIPVLVSGGLPRLLEYGLLGKGAYVLTGNVSYLASLASWAKALGSLPSPSAIGSALHGVAIVMPIILATAAAFTWHTLDRRRLTLLVFAAAAVFAAFPRWDRFHMSYALPFELVALFSVSKGWSMSSLLPGRLAAVAIGVVCLAISTVAPITALLDPGRRSSQLPHSRGIWIAAELDHDLLEAAARLAAAGQGRPTLILGSDAGFWYLSSGLKNPTPFDMPAITAVGREGVPWLLDRLAKGGIRQVCVPNEPPARLALAEVEAWVRSRFERGLDVGPCTLYRAPGSPASSTS